MVELVSILIVAIVVESAVESCKKIYSKKKINYSKLGSIALGVLICVCANLDILALLSVTMSVPFIGCIVTGLIVGRGSNFVHDTVKKVSNAKTGTE